MIHVYKAGNIISRPVFLLLHGSGGTENDLLPLTKKLDPDSTVLSVRGGNVAKNGRFQYFKRVSDEALDEKDIIFRTKELNEFLDHAAEQYAFERNNIVAIGYSDGANLAASLLFHHEEAIKGAILYHPFGSIRKKMLPNLSGKNVFISAGKNDQMCPPQVSTELKESFEKADATVELYWGKGGHYLTGEEFAASRNWFENKF